MTIRLLTAWNGYPVNALVTLDAGTETGLVTAKLADTVLTGGVAYTAPTDPTTHTAPIDAAIDPLTGAVTGLVGPGGLSINFGRQTLFNESPNTVLTDSSTTGIGTTLTAIGFVTIPGGSMGVNSKIVVNVGYTLTGNDSKNLSLRAGPASGTFATATSFGGQSGLSTQTWTPLTALIWNNGSTASQYLSPANAPNYLASTVNPIVAASIDTALDWNIYFGVQSSMANGAPTNSFTLREYFIELIK